MTSLILNIPDSVALFVLGTAMFVITLVIRRVIDTVEPDAEKREEIGVETR